MEWITAIGWCVVCGVAMRWLLEPVAVPVRPVVTRSWSLAVDGGLVQVGRTTWAGGRYGETIILRFRVESLGALPLLLRTIEQGHPELTIEDMVQFKSMAIAGVARCDRQRQRVADDCEGGR